MLGKIARRRVITCSDEVTRSSGRQATGEVAPRMSSRWNARWWSGFSGYGVRFGGGHGSVGGRERGSRAAAGAAHEPRLAARGRRWFGPAVLFGGGLAADHGGEDLNAAGRGVFAHGGADELPGRQRPERAHPVSEGWTL